MIHALVFFVMESNIGCTSPTKLSLPVCVLQIRLPNSKAVLRAVSRESWLAPISVGCSPCCAPGRAFPGTSNNAHPMYDVLRGWQHPALSTETSQIQSGLRGPAVAAGTDCVPARLSALRQCSKKHFQSETKLWPSSRDSLLLEGGNPRRPGCSSRGSQQAPPTWVVLPC